jgi:6-phosphogluconolactonase
MNEVRVYSGKEELFRAAAAQFIELAEESIQEKDQFSVALSGGSTPVLLYESLTRMNSFLAWDKIHFYWGDERHVPMDHPDSNYRMVKESLLDKINVPERNIHPVPVELDARMAAFHYEEELRRHNRGAWPNFDLVLLGMGLDGHTASLFPHTAGLHEEHRWYIANFIPDMCQWRLTLTKNAINAARTIQILVSGSPKADILAQVLTRKKHPEERPIQLISPVEGRLIWLIDQQAASSLRNEFIQTHPEICLMS